MKKFDSDKYCKDLTISTTGVNILKVFLIINGIFVASVGTMMLLYAYNQIVNDYLLGITEVGILIIMFLFEAPMFLMYKLLQTITDWLYNVEQQSRIQLSIYKCLKEIKEKIQ